MNRYLIVIGALLGALGVAAGAFGAHGLKPILTEYRFDVFQTAVSYQLWHALAIIATAILYLQFKVKYFAVAGWCFVTGIVFFSGSLYLLVLLDRAILGAITPIGGALMILGWLILARAGLRIARQN